MAPPCPDALPFSNATVDRQRWPSRGWIGLAMTGISWTFAWNHVGQISYHLFFPLWLGYVLTVDAALQYRSGTSPFLRSRWGFVLLFVASAPIWWLFEIFNSRLDNWSYELPHRYSFIRYHVEATIAFSTVLPALVVSAELMLTLRFFQQNGWWRSFRPGDTGRIVIAIGGALMVASAMIWPESFFPLVWLGLFLLLDPLNRAIGARSLNAQVAEGWWGTVMAWMAAGLACGFLWEMWNSGSLPKWHYSVPYAGGAKIFEMPLLGYGGYLPFALEIFALFALIERVFGWWSVDFTRFAIPPHHQESGLPASTLDGDPNCP